MSLLTNALSSTDMVLVYGAYQRYRGPLLATGARIFEFSKPALPGHKRDVLHSKVFLIDGTQAIVGSLNLDLRSAFTNTELGLLFDEPALVAEFTALFDTLGTPAQAYAVSTLHKVVQWRVTRSGLPALMTVEPEASWQRRTISWVVGHLPIQSYL